ncbi:hypothetical protein M011DRAFT_517980 [Sporormia fimetaria CBS 119925]|uniref:Uncharacterized protein n=1 Tax=Sporormia fimetaria CBS 119925 TaxID=1340428 RepID=A0A6A6VFR6_9PLEO|nr:hypothetical protein M011DRAFT_517980 [Sporormia fimetaria CBS 119925]
MDPPSPSKLAISPGMPLFPVSPERVAGTKPPYDGPPPQSPSLPDMRTSPIRKHRRGDSTVSSMTSMFENLGVNDPREAHDKYMQTFQKQEAKHAMDMKELQRKHAEAIARLEIRNEELGSALKAAKNALAETMPRDEWDRQRQDHREAIAKWENAMIHSEEKRKQAEAKAYDATRDLKDLRSKEKYYKKELHKLSKESLSAGSSIPHLQGKIQGLQRDARIAESDIKHHRAEAEKYKNMVYGLQIELEGVEARTNEEIATLKDRLRLVEGERDALKTSLREEEVQRIAAEGRIPLPAATVDEEDDFASPIRSPRRQRAADRGEDKENVAPRRLVVELKLAQQELATEKRLRERAQDQIDFMKMECQFRCCSCRIADLKGSHYVHDGGYAGEIERVKAAVPALTPPASAHEDDLMEDIAIKEEPLETNHLVSSTGAPHVEPSDSSGLMAEQDGVASEPSNSATDGPEDEVTVTFSPTTGTFRAVPSPAKSGGSTLRTSSPRPSLPAVVPRESSVWCPDAHSTEINVERGLGPGRTSFRESEEPTEYKTATEHLSERHSMTVHEDQENAVADSDDEDHEARTPLFEPPGPATPARYFTRTITTTTTIPLHFSPMTPATKHDNAPLTPSTVAHAPTGAQAHVLGEIPFNRLPIDREAALEAIRQRRGRARSMASGAATPLKQMMEGVKERRNVTAPLPRPRSRQ